MRRSPRVYYPYFPGDPDPFIRPLAGFGPPGGPPVPAAPPMPAQPAPQDDIFASLARIASAFSAMGSGAPNVDEGEMTLERLSPDGERIPLPDRYPALGGGRFEEEPMPYRPDPWSGDPRSGMRLLSDRGVSEAPSTDVRGSNGREEAPEAGGISFSDLYPGDPEGQGEWGINVGDDLLEFINSSRGRGSQLVGPTGRPITLPEWWARHSFLTARDRLAQLDRHHPMIQSMHSPTWVPNWERDIRPMQREAWRLQAERELGWERHHNMTNQSRDEYLKRGITDYERHITRDMMPWTQHRGAGGLHSRGWNQEIQSWFRRYPDADRSAVEEFHRDQLRFHGLLRER